MTSVPVLAGTISTVLFAASMVPMLSKAIRSHDVSSYSVGNLVLVNVGNGVHTIYVLDLPPGPIWALHGFYVVSSVIMLGCYAVTRPTASPATARIGSGHGLRVRRGDRRLPHRRGRLRR